MAMASQEAGELEVLATNRWLERSKLVKMKREQELQNIRWRNELEPFPSGSFDRLQKHGLWEKILPFLTNPTDILSAHSVCDAFEDFIGETADLTQSIEVFKILKEKEFVGREWKQGDGLDEYGLPKFVKHDVMKLRLISKSWKQAAEAVFMNDYVGDWHLHFQEKFQGGLLQWYRFPNVTSFSGPPQEGRRNVAPGKQIEKAMTILGSSSAQSVPPLISTLHIDDRSFQKLEDFSLLIQFLDTYGLFVQGLLMKSNDGESLTSRYQRLLDVLTRLPNLKALVIDFAPFSQGSRDQENPEEFQDLIKQRPFPTIPSLVLLRFGDRTGSALVVSEILEKNLNLKSLKLPNDLEDLHPPILETLNKLKFLEHFVVHEMLRLALLENSEWPLRKLSFDECLTSILFLNRVNFLLTNFANTLEHLHLNNFIVNSFHPDGLDLPKLKTLKISRLACCPTLDFLIPLQALKCVSVKELDAASEDVLETLIEGSRNVDGEKRNQSSFWRYFPNLEKVKVQSYRQEGFLYNSDGRGGYEVDPSEMFMGGPFQF